MTRRAPRGLTLIELVVAMAIFALVAVMGTQALTAMMRQRDALARHGERAAGLALAASLLRADLSAAVPMLFYPPGGAAPHSAARQVLSGFDLSIGGQPGPDLLAAPQRHRVSYRLDPATGQLTRQVWRTLMPAGVDARAPRVVVIDGLTGMTLRSHWGSTGWSQGLSPPQGVAALAPATDTDTAGGAPDVYSSALPDAVEVTLDLDGMGQVTLLETLR